jgi:hypothetical protein
VLFLVDVVLIVPLSAAASSGPDQIRHGENDSMRRILDIARHRQSTAAGPHPLDPVGPARGRAIG